MQINRIRYNKNKISVAPALRQVLHSQRNATTNITQNAERTSEETNKIGSQVKASHKATSADMPERKPQA